MNRKEKIYFFGGVNGAGKSTFLAELEKSASEFEIFQASSQFMKWLGLEPGDYQSLRAMPEEVKNRGFEKMIQYLVDKRPGSQKALIIDAHYLNLRNGEIFDVTGEWIKLMNALFLITANHQTLWGRLRKDLETKGRERNLFPQGSTEEKQKRLLADYTDQTLNKVQILSQKYKIPFFIIENSDNQLSEAVRLFLIHHESLASNKLDKN